MAVRRVADAAELPAHLSAEPWSPEAAAFRLDALRADLPFRVPVDRVFRGGNSNDAWLFDDRVLRVCWRADRQRLIREARLLEALPASIPRATTLAHGQAGEVTWVLSDRLPGAPFPEVAHDLTPAQRRSVYRRLAELLRELHDWTPPTVIARMVDERTDLDLARPWSVWAADIVPLPLSRIPAVVTLLAETEFVDQRLISAALERIDALREFDVLGDGGPGDHVIHGDATAANVLVADGQISGLIDFEHARTGPRELELLSPELFGGGYGTAWLREDYPELFAVDHLRERLWLAEICCALHNIVWWPPGGPQHPDHPSHPPLARLAQLVTAPVLSFER